LLRPPPARRLSYNRASCYHFAHPLFLIAGMIKRPLRDAQERGDALQSGTLESQGFSAWA